MIAGIKRLSFGETNSTQDFLENWLLKEELPEGTMVMADYQVNGRGQQGDWNSESGKNLLISLLFYPSFLSAQDSFFLNKTATLSVYQTIRSFFPSSDVKIKWPNDVLIQGKKTAGIILKNQILSERVKNSIWGIGINLNQISFPPALTESATSLQAMAGHPFDREVVLREFCKQADYHYLKLREGEREEIDKEFISALFGLGEDRNFVWDGKINQGRITGVDPFGRLKILTESGSRSFDMKEIQFII